MIFNENMLAAFYCVIDGNRAADPSRVGVKEWNRGECKVEPPR